MEERLYGGTGREVIGGTTKWIRKKRKKGRGGKGRGGGKKKEEVYFCVAFQVLKFCANFPSCVIFLLRCALVELF